MCDNKEITIVNNFFNKTLTHHIWKADELVVYLGWGGWVDSKSAWQDKLVTKILTKILTKLVTKLGHNVQVNVRVTDNAE